MSVFSQWFLALQEPETMRGKKAAGEGSIADQGGSGKSGQRAFAVIKKKNAIKGI
jgi:hypothetical protein